MFYVNIDIDISKCKSNTFSLECPNGTGQIKKFPEMDKYNWFTIEEAKNKIIKNQLYFINKLKKIKN